ncbi:MAG TPA: 16S rRNA (adenine(1518)-N(6)/adenine(1519)-N(6))-dimethyltransferase RsmA [Polyangiaceae bacterium]|nr:16S rRNA (adenine(1518)-N(6)/adenine(1519)-N(6))-dimethyltransferase RsmA [Polyangiaceae bacterium]
MSGVIGPKALLEHYGLRPKYSFGQNFLADPRLAARIAEACAAQGGSVVELGAGLGALTRPLLESGVSFVLAVERDRDLVAPLGSELQSEVEAGRLQILETDAKAVDFDQVLSGRPKPHVIAGNLPYQITGPLLEKAVHAAPSIERAVFLVQLEVAERLAAAPGSDAYGALSVFAQRAFKVVRAFVVRRGAFYPQPNVDSAVVTLEPLGAPAESEEFRAVVRAAFAQRRKTLKNAWSGVFGGRGLDLAACAERAGIDLSLRGETLSVAQFERMAAELVT